MKAMDIVKTFMAHPFVALGMFALATMPIEDLYRNQNKPDSADVVASLRTGMLAFGFTSGLLRDAVPATEGMGQAKLLGGKPSSLKSFFLE